MVLKEEEGRAWGLGGSHERRRSKVEGGESKESPSSWKSVLRLRKVTLRLGGRFSFQVHDLEKGTAYYPDLETTAKKKASDASPSSPKEGRAKRVSFRRSPPPSPSLPPSLLPAAMPPRTETPWLITHDGPEDQDIEPPKKKPRKARLKSRFLDAVSPSQVSLTSKKADELFSLDFSTAVTPSTLEFRTENSRREVSLTFRPAYFEAEIDLASFFLPNHSSLPSLPPLFFNSDAHEDALLLPSSVLLVRPSTLGPRSEQQQQRDALVRSSRKRHHPRKQHLSRSCHLPELLGE